LKGDKRKMTIDELKNRISMALKAPILQQGFEIICKNLAELEKENAELKADNIEWEKASDKWKNLYNSTNNQLTKAKEVLKENAELKELIKNIIRVTWGEGWNYSLDWKVKAEQFLKDCEVEK
jgi:hypothetical protein